MKYVIEKDIKKLLHPDCPHFKSCHFLDANEYCMFNCHLYLQIFGESNREIFVSNKDIYKKYDKIIDIP